MLLSKLHSSGHVGLHRQPQRASTTVTRAAGRRSLRNRVATEVETEDAPSSSSSSKKELTSEQKVLYRYVASSV